MKTEDNCDKVKDLGAKVANFKVEEWKKISKSIMTEAQRLKFSQNDDLKQFLLDTKDKILAEASPDDRLWGIGVDAETAVKINHKWDGLNLLGECIMTVRKEL